MSERPYFFALTGYKSLLVEEELEFFFRVLASLLYVDIAGESGLAPVEGCVVSTVNSGEQ